MPRTLNPAKREQIIEAARYLLLNETAQAFNIENISSYVGLAPSSIYRYFPNKADILRETLLQIRHSQVLIINECCAQTEDPLQRIDLLFRRFAVAAARGDCLPSMYHSRSFIKEYPDLFKEVTAAVLASSPYLPMSTRSGLTGISVLISNLAKDARAQKRLKAHVDADSVSFIFFSCVHALKVLRSTGTLEDAVRLAIDTWTLFLSGIKTDG